MQATQKAKTSYLQSKQTCKNKTDNLPKIIENSRFFMILGGLGASGADLAKKFENVQILMKNIEKIDEVSLSFCVWSGAKELTSCRSRKMLINAPTLAI